MALGKSKAR